MASTTLQITLPEPLKAYVEAKGDSGTYGNPSGYVRELILDDRDRQLTRLEDRLLLNLKSAPVEFSHDELTQPNFIDICRAKLQARR